VTIVPINTHGLAEIIAALHREEAVVLPFPSPLPYVVAATRAATVNQAKGRPSRQPCGILTTADRIRPHLDLDDATAELSIWISEAEQVNLLAPVVPDAPHWLSSGAVNGFVGVTLAWLAETRPLADEFGYLFVSSGNLTTGRVGVTAPEVDSIFGGQRLVLDGDHLRDDTAAHGSATILRVRRHGLLEVVRDGINNRSLTADNSAYLEALRSRFADRQHAASAALEHGRVSGRSVSRRDRPRRWYASRGLPAPAAIAEWPPECRVCVPPRRSGPITH
jgi:hypothetical protein